MKLDTLVVEIEAETKKFQKEVDDAEDSIEDFADKSEESSERIKDAIGAISYGAIAKELKDLALSSMDAASDLAEVQNVIDVSFGAMGWKVEEFAKSSIEQFGIAELAAKQTAGTYMSMGTAMGVAKGQAAEMALQITGLSGDMASFYNVSQEVAASALRGIWTGETEALKNYGIVMNETSLQEYALSQGIKTKISDMSEAEKVQLRYNFVMQATANAQGDFVRTSGGYSNQVKMLEQNMQQLNATAGESLIVFAEPFLQTFNEALTWLNSESPIAAESIKLVSSTLAGLGLVAAGMSFTKLMNFLNTSTLQFAGLGIAIGTVIYSLGVLSSAWGNLSGADQAITVIAGLTAAIVAASIAFAVFNASINVGLGVAVVAGMVTAAATAKSLVDEIPTVDSGMSYSSATSYDVGAAIGVDNYAGSASTRAYRAQQMGVYANGGVLTKPTIGLMAEYPGASQNPEIVTPQSLMYDTVKQALSETVGSDTVTNISVELDGDVIYRNQQRIKSKRGYDYSDGMGAFAR